MESIRVALSRFDRTTPHARPNFSVYIRSFSLSLCLLYPRARSRDRSTCNHGIATQDNAELHATSSWRDPNSLMCAQIAGANSIRYANRTVLCAAI